MRILVTGASGKLGAYLLQEFAARQQSVWACSRTQPEQASGHTWRALDLTDFAQLFRLLDDCSPDVVIHTAALSAVADCYSDPARADLVNHQVTAELARWCESARARLIHTSTDMVFSGNEAPYDEDAPTNPLSRYGESKARAEQAALRYSGSLVVRLPLMVGPALGRAQSFYDHVVHSFQRGECVRLFQDEWRSMLTYSDAARALAELSAVPETGILHVPGTRTSRFSLGKMLARALGAPEELAIRATRAENPAPEPRPRDLTLTTQRLRQVLPKWRRVELKRQIPEMVREAAIRVRKFQA